jgi:hypothetical protein
MAAEKISTSQSWDFDKHISVSGVLLSRRTGVGKHNSVVYDLLVHGTGSVHDGEQTTIWSNKVMDEKLINLPTKSLDPKGIGTYVYITYDGVPPGKNYKMFTIMRETDYNGDEYLQRTGHRPFTPAAQQAAPAYNQQAAPAAPVAPAHQQVVYNPGQPAMGIPPTPPPPVPPVNSAPAFLVLPTMRNYQGYLVNTQGQYINGFGIAVAPQQAIAIQTLSPEAQAKIPAYGIPAQNAGVTVTPNAGVPGVPGNAVDFNDDLPF